MISIIYTPKSTRRIVEIRRAAKAETWVRFPLGITTTNFSINSSRANRIQQKGCFMWNYPKRKMSLPQKIPQTNLSVHFFAINMLLLPYDIIILIFKLIKPDEHDKLEGYLLTSRTLLQIFLCYSNIEFIQDKLIFLYKGIYKKFSHIDIFQTIMRY